MGHGSIWVKPVTRLQLVEGRLESLVFNGTIGCLLFIRNFVFSGLR